MCVCGIHLLLAHLLPPSHLLYPSRCWEGPLLPVCVPCVFLWYTPSSLYYYLLVSFSLKAAETILYSPCVYLCSSGNTLCLSTTSSHALAASSTILRHGLPRSSAHQTNNHSRQTMSVVTNDGTSSTSQTGVSLCRGSLTLQSASFLIPWRHFPWDNVRSRSMSFLPTWHTGTTAFCLPCSPDDCLRGRCMWISPARRRPHCGVPLLGTSSQDNARRRPCVPGHSCETRCRCGHRKLPRRPPPASQHDVRSRKEQVNKHDQRERGFSRSLITFSCPPAFLMIAAHWSKRGDAGPMVGTAGGFKDGGPTWVMGRGACT